MELLKLSEANKRDTLSLMLGVATAQGSLELHKIHQQTIEAIGRHVLGIDVKLDELPNNFDMAENIADSKIQEELLHLVGPLIFLETEDKKRRIEALEQLATLWKHKDGLIKSIHKAVEGHKTAILMCEFRATKAETGASALYQSFYYLATKLHLVQHRKVYERYQKYGQYPEGSFGKTLYNYYMDNEFSLPGSPGAELNDILVKHDMHHVLSGYDTSPLGEICVLAFDGAMSKVDFSAQISAATAQFQIGYTIADPTVNSWVNQFKPEMVYEAYQRGKECSVNYIDANMDLTPYLQMPIKEVRKQFNISEEGMLVQTDKDKWCSVYGPPSKRKNPDLIKYGKSIQ
ncbi:hypothetical protein [Aureibacter tunicatorum]|uniref:Ubiquinone biosynthesis protein Coq4 n=1 Tax=Aureibacter tunicatorum TaxID=866807 RepID=A0AAE3XHR8_9BACT|nr:hypothetical protein [Aureibacter tunicatorum]MDR6237047.1 ubiquinone biosynthesis protein Coq4 [Aureibacter tunicatorum]BDD06039.1 hypothetical protein AUTU_35220 [Aureibacter tunicatorum]